jgi:hypothetical protein
LRDKGHRPHELIVQEALGLPIRRRQHRSTYLDGLPCHRRGGDEDDERHSDCPLPGSRMPHETSRTCA